MASARTFSQKMFTSPAPSGSALESRTDGRDKGVSSSVKALQIEETSQNETSSAFLGNSGNLRPLFTSKKENKSLNFNDLDEKNEQKKRRNNRFKLLHLLAQQIWQGRTPPHQARFCSRKAIPSKTFSKKKDKWVDTGMPGVVQLHQYKEHDHGYYGMYHCGSALICPYCAGIIQARRSIEVMQAGIQMLKNGYQIGMVTQTASHSAHTSLYDFVQRFQAAQHDMKSWREYKKWKALTGARFSIRSVETTDDNPDYSGRKSGWHFHSHTLLFFDRKRAFTESEVKKFTRMFQRLWVKALESVGLSGSIERAAVFSLPKATKALDDARNNLAHPENDENISKLCAYVAKAFSYEVSNSITKEGRDKDRRISVWKLQELALTTHPQLFKRYVSYMVAVKGLAWLSWSPGLKAFCKISDISDEDLMKGESGEEIIYQFTEPELKKLARFALQGKLIEVANEAGEDSRNAVLQAMNQIMTGYDPETGTVLESLESSFIIKNKDKHGSG